MEGQSSGSSLRPVFMDKAATLKKTIKIIEDAGKQELELLVFPETYVPGYPVCVSNLVPAPHPTL